MLASVVRVRLVKFPYHLHDAWTRNVDYARLITCSVSFASRNHCFDYLFQPLFIFHDNQRIVSARFSPEYRVWSVERIIQFTIFGWNKLPSASESAWRYVTGYPVAARLGQHALSYLIQQLYQHLAAISKYSLQTHPR